MSPLTVAHTAATALRSTRSLADALRNRHTRRVATGVLFWVMVGASGRAGRAQLPTGTITRVDDAHGVSYRTESVRLRGVTLASMTGDPYDPIVFPEGTPTVTFEITEWGPKGYPDGRACKGGTGPVTRTVKGSFFFLMGDDVLWGQLMVPSIKPNPAVQGKGSASDISGTLRLELRNVRFTWDCPLYRQSQTRNVGIDVLSFPQEGAKGTISPERVATGTRTYTESSRCSEFCQTPLTTTWSWSLQLPRSR